jgi:hypothetical protein
VRKNGSISLVITLFSISEWCFENHDVDVRNHGCESMFHVAFAVRTIVMIWIGHRSATSSRKRPSTPRYTFPLTSGIISIAGVKPDLEPDGGLCPYFPYFSIFFPDVS